MITGDIILVGEVTDRTLKMGLVRSVSALLVRTEPVVDPNDPGNTVGAWASFERHGLPIRVLPNIQAAFAMQALRREYLNERRELAHSFEERVSAWIGTP